MKPCTKCRVIKPLDEFPVQKRSKDGRDCWCKACHRAKTNEYRLANLEKVRAAVRTAQAKWTPEEKAALAAYVLKWHSENREVVRAHKRKWRNGNLERARAIEIASREKYREQMLERKRVYFKANKHLWTAYANKRRARLLNATPGWADFDKITAIYKECAELSALLGVQHHVDHIIPLQGRNVCGLHVENNLQILEGLENRRKANKY